MTIGLIERLAACYTGAVHDVLRELGHDHFVLPPAIKAIAPGTRLAGPVWTVEGEPDRTRSRHDCLLGWCTLLARAPAGHVVVCQPNTREIALMGELSAQTLKARGVRGYVVDGGSRDTELVLEQGFPVFCAFLTPADIVERWVPRHYAQPVTIGDVTIQTGEIVLTAQHQLGDALFMRQGGEVQSFAICHSVPLVEGRVTEEMRVLKMVARTEAVVATESDMRRALIGGMDPVEAYLQFGKF